MIPPHANSAFVATMEAVLDVYKRPRAPWNPLVCFDEAVKQLIKETRLPIAMKPEHPTRYDYEYERNGTATMFMMFAPLEGWRHVAVTDRHTAIDYAQVLQELADVHFSDADLITLVQDNLNTHNPASLYESFPAPEARRLVKRFEWVYTPKHGSWLNMAESELACYPRSVLIDAFPTNKYLSMKSPHGKLTATNTTPKPIGSSQPTTRALNSNTSILILIESCH